MQNIKLFQKKIQEEIGKLKFDKKPFELYEPISYILSLGGKRLRPTLALIGCDLFDGNIEDALYPAIGIEVFHNFTLLHDDIMDNAPLRRSKPTVHEKWNSNIAILSGDTMFVIAYQLTMKTKDPVLRPVLDLFNETAIKVCEGQQFDMNFETLNNVSIVEYMKMIELKTAVLLAASLKTGAIIGRASDSDAKHLYDFGKNIGIAFQLQDDILDVYGNPEEFGKQVGGDIVSNKKTFLLLKAFEIANKYSKEELGNWIHAPQFNPAEKVEAVTQIFNFLNIRVLAEKEMDKYFEAGLASLNKIEGNGSADFTEKKEALRLFAEGLMARKI